MPGIVNAQLMARFATKFNLGADILGKGNRTVEKMLGADKMSGDTVSVTIMDSGKIFKNSLDLTGQKGTLAVQRASVPVSVKPIGTAAEASVGELTLAMTQPEIMGKRVANLQNEINKMAYRCLLGGSQPFVATAGLSGTARDQAYREAAFDAEAFTNTSKFSGNTFGIAHPQTWNRVVPSLMGNFGANDKIGKDLYANELGDFLGFRWTRGMDTMRITGAATGVANITIGTNGQLVAPIATIAGAVGTENGEICPLPIPLVDANGDVVECVDALGKPTGVQKMVFFKWDSVQSGWVLALPLFLRGPRKNAHSKEYEAQVAQFEAGVLDKHGFIDQDFEWHPDQNWNAIRGQGAPAQFVLTNLNALTSAVDVLTVGKTYLAPLVMWKEPDFLVAVKGIEKMSGADSFTIPTDFSDRGIMPWRGTYWTDPYSSLSLFRVDALFGFGVYQGCSMASVFIPID